MGLKPIFISIAEEIGVDAFLTMWRLLDSDERNLSDNGATLLVRMRPYRSYQRYQRDRFILALDREGVKPAEIKVRLLKQLGETLSEVRIVSILKKHTKSSA